MELQCYYDFTCGYSYRAWLWFERLRNEGVEIHIDWLPFVLKEVNRREGEPSLLTGPTIRSVAVLALTAAEALRGEPGSDDYRRRVFRAMHESEERPRERDLEELADAAGVDGDSFSGSRTAWLEKVRDHQESAVSRYGVFGTPTLVVDGAPMYLKLTAVPSDGDLALWTAITSITAAFPQVAELKRPVTREPLVSARRSR